MKVSYDRSGAQAGLPSDIGEQPNPDADSSRKKRMPGWVIGLNIAGGVTSTSDLPSATQLVDESRDYIRKDNPNAKMVSDGRVTVALTKAGNRELIELATMRMGYSVPEGNYASILFIRSLPHAGNELVVQLVCPPELFDGANSPLQEVLDQLVVVPVP